jgi:hypothetical protein
MGTVVAIAAPGPRARFDRIVSACGARSILNGFAITGTIH